jgi:hypothetical protein
MEALLLVVEQKGPPMFARLEMMRALQQEDASATTEARKGLPGHQVIARVARAGTR